MWCIIYRVAELLVLLLQTILVGLDHFLHRDTHTTFTPCIELFKPFFGIFARKYLNFKFRCIIINEKFAHTKLYYDFRDDLIKGEIPYKIYYMSCNLGHALYGKLNSSDNDKEADAFAFAQRFKDDIPGFIEYVRESDFSVVESYPQSWQYIKEGLHSLERHTNFGICFQSNFLDPKGND